MFDIRTGTIFIIEILPEITTAVSAPAHETCWQKSHNIHYIPNNV